MNKHIRLSIIFIVFAIVFLNVFPAYPADNDSPEKITDLSDRKYEQALIDLLDNAEARLREAFNDLKKIERKRL